MVRYWHGYLSEVRCKSFAYGPADATATHISCFIKIQISLTFVVPAYLGCRGKEAIKRVSVCHITHMYVHTSAHIAHTHTHTTNTHQTSQTCLHTCHEVVVRSHSIKTH